MRSCTLPDLLGLIVSHLIIVLRIFFPGKIFQHTLIELYSLPHINLLESISQFNSRSDEIASFPRITLILAASRLFCWYHGVHLRLRRWFAHLLSCLEYIRELIYREVGVEWNIVISKRIFISFSFPLAAIIRSWTICRSSQKSVSLSRNDAPNRNSPDRSGSQRWTGHCGLCEHAFYDGN